MQSLPERAIQQRVCYLETIGRVTGKPHDIEIWFAADPEDALTLYLLSGGRDRRDWVKNILRNPAVSLRIGEGRYQGTARVLAPDDETDRKARETVAAKYQGWRAGQPFSQWASESLAVAIELQGETT